MKQVPVKPETPPPPAASGLLNLSFTSGGKPIATRVAVTDAENRPLVALPGFSWIWAEEKVTVRLPEGPLNLSVSAGPRRLVSQKIVAPIGDREISETIELPSFWPVTESGWWLCDPFVPAALGPGDPFFSAPEDLSGAIRGEGIEAAGISGLGRLESPAGVPFSALPERVEAEARALRLLSRERFSPAAAYAFRTPENLRFYAVLPAPCPEPESTVPLSRLAETVARLRDRGGLVVLQEPGSSLGKENGARAAAALFFAAAAGPLFDAIDPGPGAEDTAYWQTLMGLGWPIPAVGGGPLNSVDLPSLGCYVRGEMEAPPAAWIGALRSGRSSLSSGPFLDLRVDEAGPGDSLPPRAARRPVLIRAVSCSDLADEIERVELLINGKKVESWDGVQAQKTMQIRGEQDFPDLGWVQARCFSRAPGRSALTNPIWIRTGRFGPPGSLEVAVSVVLRDREGKVLRGRLQVLALGEPVETLELGPEPVEVSLPATARLRVETEGREPRELSLWEEGGLADALVPLFSADPAAALADWEVWRAARDKVARLQVVVAWD